MKQNGKEKNIAIGYQSKIIASALSIPSNRAKFFKSFSVFNEIVNGKNIVNIWLINLSINRLVF